MTNRLRDDLVDLGTSMLSLTFALVVYAVLEIRMPWQDGNQISGLHATAGALFVLVMYVLFLELIRSWICPPDDGTARVARPEDS